MSAMHVPALITRPPVGWAGPARPLAEMPAVPRSTTLRPTGPDGLSAAGVRAILAPATQGMVM